jgi:hypothetical protein
VAGAYPGGDVIDVSSDGAPTDEFIVQHMETDWEFLRRMASRFNTGIVCDVRFDAPKFFFGVPEGQSLELGGSNYLTRKSAHKFEMLSQNGVAGLRESDFICHEVETNLVAMVGDRVTFQRKLLRVSEVTSMADKGVFVSRLILTPQGGLAQPRMQHANIVGASFSGRVTESRNDQVKVCLDIDLGHDPGEPCFFPYSTVYSSQDGSGWYCMPENGDAVRVYCPDGEDGHAYAINAVHERVNADMLRKNHGDADARAAGSGGYSGQRDDPQVKSLTYGDKEVRLTPEGIYIMMNGSMITMTDEGITFTSQNDISFKSDKGICFSSDDSISIVGASNVDILCGETAGFVIDEDVQVVGQEVKAN